MRRCFTLVEGLGGVEGPFDTGGLGITADRVRRAEGGSFEGFKQFSTGDINHSNGVAEGQHGVDILLADIAYRDGSADAAAVGDADDRVGLNLFNAAFLHNGPDHGVGDQVAQVGFFRTVSGSLIAVEQDFGCGEDSVVFLVNLGHDLLSLGHDIFVDELEAVQLGTQVGGNQKVAFNALGFIIDHHNADVGKLGAGGLDGLAVLTGGHDGVAVAVQHHVDAGDLGQRVNGTVAVGLGLIVHAQVEQADHEVRVSADFIHGLLGRFIQLVKGGKGDHVDQAGVDLGDGFGSFHTDETDLQAAFRGDDSGGGENCLSRFIQRDAGADHREFGIGQVVHQLSITEVEFMVAQCHNGVAGGVHHLDSSGTLAGTDINGALAEVTGVGQDHFSAQGFEVITQAGDIGITIDLAVYVVGMQDDGLAGIILGQFILEISLGGIIRGGPVSVFRESGTAPQQQTQGQQNTKQFSHAKNPP